MKISRWVIPLVACFLLLSACDTSSPGGAANKPIYINMTGAQLTFQDTSAIPDVTGNTGKVLGNDGVNLIWTTTNGSGNVSTWGDIGGTLANQVDLQTVLTALNATARIDTINNSVVSLNASVISLNSSLATLNGTFVTLNGTVVTLNQTVVNLSGNLTTVNSTLTQSIVNVSGNLSAHIGNITPHVPDQAGQAGRYLTTNGTVTSWATPPGGGNVSVWGDIGGTLANQVDLQAALDAKGVGNVTYAGNLTDWDAILASKSASYNASVMTVNQGTLTAGTVTDLNAIGGTNVTIQEENGADPLTVTINFTSVATFPTSLMLLGSYNGSHTVAVQIWDYDVSEWDTLFTLNQELTNEWYVTPILPANYNAGNTTQIRFYHSEPGVSTHGLILDYIILQQSLSVGGGAHDAHVHSNKSILDAITESFTTALKSGYDAVVSFLNALRQAYIDYIPTLNATVNNHVANTSNPHSVTAAQAGALAVANVTTTPAAAKVPEGDANATVDQWITRYYYTTVIADSTNLTTGVQKASFTILPIFAGWEVVDVGASVNISSSSGTPTIGIYNATTNVSILSTNITIDTSELTSITAATPAVIYATSNGTVASGDKIRLDVWVAGTGTCGLQVWVGIRRQ